MSTSRSSPPKREIAIHHPLQLIRVNPQLPELFPQSQVLSQFLLSSLPFLLSLLLLSEAFLLRLLELFRQLTNLLMRQRISLPEYIMPRRPFAIDLL